MATLDVSDPRHPLHLQPSDNPGNVIISIQLKGSENYSVWSRAMKIALRVKRKMGFIDGTCGKDLYKDDLEEE
ncbi:hypothetical protein R3W88_016709 [Solanum pinnatisectum]|uniref:Retrotransposon Copia-like N-terminal domain-containing protein n=1 Tax=Solanum pinnatisectum TaxID=50273 RepID=A0AAV9KYI1_9SOLN|nr:hypothetical protein R3W88_016709 [Solanum pinnatisectum]